MMLGYNYNLTSNLNTEHSLNNFKFHNRKNSLLSSASTPIINSKLNQFGSNKTNLDLLPYLSFLDKNSLLSSENDSVQLNNPLKYALNNK
jgi:hypothetical protein